MYAKSNTEKMYSGSYLIVLAHWSVWLAPLLVYKSLVLLKKELENLNFDTNLKLLLDLKVLTWILCQN